MTSEVADHICAAVRGGLVQGRGRIFFSAAEPEPVIVNGKKLRLCRNLSEPLRVADEPAVDPEYGQGVYLPLKIREEQMQIAVCGKRRAGKIQAQNRVLHSDIGGYVPEDQVPVPLSGIKRMLIKIVENAVQKSPGRIIAVFAGAPDEKAVVVPEGIAVRAEGFGEITAHQRHPKEGAGEEGEREHDPVPPIGHQTGSKRGETAVVRLLQNTCLRCGRFRLRGIFRMIIRMEFCKKGNWHSQISIGRRTAGDRTGGSACLPG